MVIIRAAKLKSNNAAFEAGQLKEKGSITLNSTAFTSAVVRGNAVRRPSSAYDTATHRLVYNGNGSKNVGKKNEYLFPDDYARYSDDWEICHDVDFNSLQSTDVAEFFHRNSYRDAV